MRITFQVGADSRHDQGKGASRRLRRAGKVPAVLYGGEGEPRNITLDHQQLLTLIGNEKFYSSIISVNVDAQAQPAIVRDVQMHPARNAVVHVDLQRVLENEKLKIHLPIHFKGEAVAPGVKTQGGIVSHLIAGRGGQLPAERSAGISRARSVGHESQRHAAHSRHPAARRESRFRSWRIATRRWCRCTARVSPSPSRRRWQRRRKARLQRRRRQGCAAAEGAAAAGRPSRRRRQEGGAPRRKARSSQEGRAAPVKKEGGKK